MWVLDTSSIVYGWDNYPISQFPGLWDWLSIEIGNEAIAIPAIAIGEVSHVSPECREWLDQQSIVKLQITNAILHDANRIKALAGIVGDNYGPKGVGENDIIIIATARSHAAGLISDEQRQVAPPGNPANKRIPAVCEITGVDVSCINFLEYIRASGAVFR